MGIRIKIWGAQGSLPAPMTTDELQMCLREVLMQSRGMVFADAASVERFINRLPSHLNSIVGGNTSCVEVRTPESLIICDLGSGIRRLGKQLLTEGFGEGQGVAHIFISHTHWDHLEGYPYFTPAYIPGNEFHFYSPFPDMEDRLRHMMIPPYFPVDLDYLSATHTFTVIQPGEVYAIAGAQVKLMELKHPGTSYAYRFTHGGKAFVYATDGEYPKADPEHTAMFEDFFRGADALLFDAMYTYEDAVTSKVNWGHSTARVGADLAWRAGVRRLILSHHDPDSSQQQLWAKIADADQHLRLRNARSEDGPRRVEVMLAIEGLVIDL